MSEDVSSQVNHCDAICKLRSHFETSFYSESKQVIYSSGREKERA